MTLEQAQQITWMFNQNKATIERASLRQEPDGDYVVDVVYVNGTEESFKNAEEAHWALARQVGEEMREGGLYATLNEDGIPVQCDFETWKTWMFKDLEKRQAKITCSPDIEATITFTGHSPAQVSLDGRAKFWSVSFYSASRNEHYGWGPGVFATRDEAEACVTRYINKGCPPPGAPDWFSA